MRYERYRAQICEVAAANQVDPELIFRLLALEPQHPDLRLPAARADLRASLAQILDPLIAAGVLRSPT